MRFVDAAAIVAVAANKPELVKRVEATPLGVAGPGELVYTNQQNRIY